MRAGWEIKRLGDLCDLITKGTTPTSIGFKFTEEGVNFIKVESLTESGQIIPNKVAYITTECHESLKRSQLKENDILFSIAGALGRIGIVNKEILPANTNQALAIIRIANNSGVSVNYLSKYFTSDAITDEIEILKGGAAQQNLSLGQLNNLLIPVPALPEQQRIVAILDEAFAAIDKAKANAEKNLKNAKELFESYLQGVFENNGDSWEIKPLKDITSKIGSGSTPRGGKENYKTEGISLVRSMNVYDWEFRARNLAFIDENQAKELNSVTLYENDVLLNITGASVARSCVFPKKYLPARVNQHVSIIRPKKEILDSKFLNYLLTSKPYKDFLLFTGEQGATRQAITKAQIEALLVAIPPLTKQIEIVAKIESVFKESKRLISIYQQKLIDLEELKKSILQKAFNGELNKDKLVVV